ncbi:MAG: TfoX/Sxy family DNA transformation protein, partial [Pseudomonadota bacterium]
VRALGTDAAYGRLLVNGHSPHFIGYYVLEMGLQGRPWNDCKGDEKKALRARFDALVASHHDVGLTGLEKVLNEIGVVPK